MVEMEPKILHMLDKCYTAELHPSLIIYIIVEKLKKYRRVQRMI
jgi:hypothetical protein